jgi:geranylgeranyl diphosphate synthase type II
MVDTLTTFAQYAEEVRPRIDAALGAYCDLDDGCPSRLAEAIRYSLLAPGNRLRPLLVLMSAEACGGDLEEAMPAACAVEMIHAYSLVHDDLPAMDDDDLRRGRPTCHKVFGEGLAILAGDALQAMAFEALAGDLRPPAVAARCCAALARAAGPSALVGGQADDLAGEFTQGGIDVLESIHARKTGAMLNVCLELGGIVAGAEEEQTKALLGYGRRLGLAFQITDDLLDVRGDAQTIGKRVGKDSVSGKLTFPGLLGVEESSRRAEQLVAEARAALAPLGARGQHLDVLAQYVLERDR